MEDGGGNESFGLRLLEDFARACPLNIEPVSGTTPKISGLWLCFPLGGGDLCACHQGDKSPNYGHAYLRIRSTCYPTGYANIFVRPSEVSTA